MWAQRLPQAWSSKRPEGSLATPPCLIWIQASEEAIMQGGKLLALVIIMLSALEEQVFGFFFFLVFLIT